MGHPSSALVDDIPTWLAEVIQPMIDARIERAVFGSIMSEQRWPSRWACWSNTRPQSAQCTIIVSGSCFGPQHGGSRRCSERRLGGTGK